VLWRKGRLYENCSFLKTLLVIHPLGFLATEFGWITNEVGRQPWLVYRLFRTSEGVSPIPAGNVIWSLSLFLIIFLVVGTSYFYYVLKTLRTGPDLASPIPPIQRLAGMRPLQKEGKGDSGIG
jgi:cytochrome d ubiquinol oxidase subunit I